MSSIPPLQASAGLIARCRDRTLHFSAVIVAAECKRRHINRGQIHVELVEIVASAITSFLAKCRIRFPRLTRNLSGRFATDRLPSAMVCRMRTTVIRAVAKRLDLAPVIAVKIVETAPAVAVQARQPRTGAEAGPLHGPMFILVGTRAETQRAAQAAGYRDVRAWVAALLNA